MKAQTLNSHDCSRSKRRGGAKNRQQPYGRTESPMLSDAAARWLPAVIAFPLRLSRNRLDQAPNRTFPRTNHTHLPYSFPRTFRRPSLRTHSSTKAHEAKRTPQLRPSRFLLYEWPTTQKSQTDPHSSLLPQSFSMTTKAEQPPPPSAEPDPTAPPNSSLHRSL